LEFHGSYYQCIYKVVQLYFWHPGHRIFIPIEFRGISLHRKTKPGRGEGSVDTFMYYLQKIRHGRETVICPFTILSWKVMHEIFVMVLVGVGEFILKFVRILV
jgi:hypothetical protein